MIIFEKVIKKYKNRAVLDKVDLKIENGEFVSIIGPSGAGKSTLIHTLIGAEKIQGGSIAVDGFKVQDMSEKQLQFYRRKVGVVFQDYKLLPQKTVFENVAFALEVCGFGGKEMEKRVWELLDLVGLRKQARHFPNQLSGGERQRTAIARALVHDPGLIAADEPTGNLDPQTALEIIKLLKKLNDEGKTLILTTHNKDLVNFLNKRVVKIDEGKVVSDKGEAGYES